jgi:hypothetical protein
LDELFGDYLARAGGPRGFRVRPLGDSLRQQRGLELQQYSRDLRPHRSCLGKPSLPSPPAGKKTKLPSIPMPGQLAAI